MASKLLITTAAIAALALASLTCCADDRVLGLMRARAEALAKALGGRRAGFWLAAVEATPDQCKPEFARDLRAEYAALPDRDRYEWLVDKVRQRTVEYCSEHFAHLSAAMPDIVHHRMRVRDRRHRSGAFVELPDLEDFTDGVYADTVAKYDSELARRVARLVRDVWQDAAADSVQRFYQAYLKVNPCNHLYDQLDESPDMAAYAQFLRLAAVPECYPSTGWSHIAYVDVVAACDHIKRSKAVIESAYAIYNSME